jgi:FkbM family methyltransferase
MIQRFIHRLLARHPLTYLRLLRLAQRGSIEKRVFLSLVRKGQVVFDVGANRGHFAKLFSDIVGNSGQVNAFEPFPSTFKLLQSNLAHCNNCQLYNVALGDAAGTAILNLPGTDDGQASLRTHTHASWSVAEQIHRHECRMTTLDKIATDLTRLDFIKCDVEGAELLVLQGARSTLDRLSPILFLEVFDKWTIAFDYTPADLVCFLRDIGYSTIFLVDGFVRPLRDPSEITGSVNLLCAKPGMLPDVLEA